MRELSMGEMFDRELESSSPQSAEKHPAEEIGKYLKPPFTFELPPSGKKLMPRDPGYDHYMCRKNVAGNLMNSIDRIARNMGSDIPEPNRLRLYEIIGGDPRHLNKPRQQDQRRYGSYKRIGSRGLSYTFFNRSFDTLNKAWSNKVL